MPDGSEFGEHPVVCRFLKGIFELRPSLPKYTEIWDVAKVLEYLKTLSPAKELSLKMLTKKGEGGGGRGKGGRGGGWGGG